MQRSVRSALVGGFAATVLAAGAITAAPDSLAGAQRSTTAAVTLTAIGFNCKTCVSTTIVLDPTPIVYAPADAWAVESVSHALGVVPQLLGDAMNPPVLVAIAGQQMSEVAAAVPHVYADLAAFGGYTNAAAAVVGQRITIALGDTVTPTQWGGGRVLQSWADAGGALQAMTIGIGATVDGAWVPSLRVAAISIRNQVANDIAGRSPTSTGALPNYAAHYVPLSFADLPAYPSVGHCSGCGCVLCDVAAPSAAQPATVKTARSAAHVTAKAAAVRTRSAR